MTTMTRRGIIGLSLLLVTTVAVRAADVDYPKALADAQQTGDAAAVSRLCGKWAAAEPGDERPRIVLGQTLLKAGMMDQAIEQFELAAEANPLSPAPRCEVGQMFLATENWQAAASEFGEALRLDPTCVVALVGQGRVKLGQGDARSALADVKLVLSKHGKSFEAHVLSSDCLVALDRLDEAETELRVAVDVDPGSADALYGLAKVCQINGKVDEAQQLWIRFLAAEPSGPRAQVVRLGCVVLRTVGPTNLRGSWPGWSPDGKRIVHGHGSSGISISDLHDDGRTVQLRDPEGFVVLFPDWSPDGKRIAACRRPTGGTFSVVLYDLLPAGGLAFSDYRPPVNAVGVRFSPDGGKLLLGCASEQVAQGRGRALGDLAVLDMVTDGIVKVPWPESADSARRSRNRPAWGPDGDVIVFHAFAKELGDDRAVFAMRLRDPSSAKQLSDNGKMNAVPAVRPDGGYVAFDTWLDGTSSGPSSISVVALSGKPVPVVVMEGQTPAWSPDGQRLAYYSLRAKRVVIAQLGGLDNRPVGIVAQRNGEALSVVVTGRSEATQQVSLRWGAFDANSTRVGEVGESEGASELKPGEKIEWTPVIPAEDGREVVTVKVTVLNQDGVGAVKLMDWVEETK